MTDQKLHQPLPRRDMSPDVVRFRQSMVTVFLGAGLLYAMISNIYRVAIEARQEKDSFHKNKTASATRILPERDDLGATESAARLRQAFMRRHEALGLSRPLVILDGNRVLEDPDSVVQTLKDRFGNTLVDEAAQELASGVTQMAMEGNGSVAGGYGFETPDGRAVEFYVVLDMPGTTLVSEGLTTILGTSGWRLRPETVPSRAEMACMVLWHECFGHCTEEDSIFMARVPRDDPGLPFLRELRADAMGMAAMVREAGHDGPARRMCDMRTLSAFHGEIDENYATIAQRSQIVARLGAVMADPARRTAFMSLDDRGLLQFVDMMLAEIVPSVPELENSIWSLDDVRRFRSGELSLEALSPNGRNVLAGLDGAEKRLLVKPAPCSCKPALKM